MPSDLALDERAPVRTSLGRVLFIAWQVPETRSITPVGRLRILPTGTTGDFEFEFRYLRAATSVLARPFASFPVFEATYRSSQLFPFFENRMVPVHSPDFAEMAASLGLADSTDPFEVLATSGGLRATDTIEVFPEPTIDVERREASFRFLVRGVRHRPDADDQIEHLRVGDRLRLEPQPDNPVDSRALLVMPDSGVAVGWAPAYLCPTLHRSARTTTSGWDNITTTVRHIGDRSGPPHFRLLCEIRFPWPFSDGPFENPDFALYPA
jgi:hypothetical protein